MAICQPSLLDNAPNYIPSWVRCPKVYVYKHLLLKGMISDRYFCKKSIFQNQIFNLEFLLLSWTIKILTHQRSTKILFHKICLFFSKSSSCLHKSIFIGMLFLESFSLLYTDFSSSSLYLIKYFYTWSTASRFKIHTSFESWTKRCYICIEKKREGFDWYQHFFFWKCHFYYYNSNFCDVPKI